MGSSENRIVEGEERGAGCGRRQGGRRTGRRGAQTVVGINKTPSPTAGARVVADKDIAGEGRRVRRRAGRRTQWTASGAAPVAPHSVAQMRHRGDDRRGNKLRPSSSGDRARTNRIKARGLSEMPEVKRRQLR